MMENIFKMDFDEFFSLHFNNLNETIDSDEYKRTIRELIQDYMVEENYYVVDPEIIEKFPFEVISHEDGVGEYKQNCHTVIKFKDSGKLVMVTYHHESYGGYNWDECCFYEVKPVTKVVTTYETN